MTGLTSKQAFEPFLEQLLLQSQGTSIHIDEVWSLDIPLCGENALLNPKGYLYGR